jgi:hypothetical protein
MICPRGSKKQRFGVIWHVSDFGVQQDLADLFRSWCAARFPGEDDFMSD